MDKITITYTTRAERKTHWVTVNWFALHMVNNVLMLTFSIDDKETREEDVITFSEVSRTV